MSKYATERIDEFTKKFVELKGMLDTGIHIQGALVSSRMLGMIDIVGKMNSFSNLLFIADLTNQ